MSGLSVTAQQQKNRAAALSVLSNTSLVALKVVIGLATGSVSVVSEAIHSGVDLLAAVIAWIAVRSSSKPADRLHPFGHGKYENLSGAIEALLIFLAAGWIIYEAAHKLIRPEPTGALGWGVGVMLVSSVVNWLISRHLMRIGKQTDSVALQADAWHLRTDVYTSAGVMVGLAVMMAGNWLFPGVDLRWLDPVAAIVVALLILQAAWELTAQASRDLVDAALPAEEVVWIEDFLRGFAPTARGIHNLRTRKAGASRFIEVHVVVDALMTVEDSHAITQRMSHGIRERFPDTLVTVHIEPCRASRPQEGCPAHCRAGCQLPAT